MAAILSISAKIPTLPGKSPRNYILGVQSQNVVATVKHYAANNSEYHRRLINAIIDERTLREIYLPAFEAAVKEGHVGAVMDSYNLINGEHATQNKYLNTDVLKNRLGISRHSDVGLGRDARWHCRGQLRAGSEDARRRIHERQNAFAGDSRRARFRSRRLTTKCAAFCASPWNSAF